MRILIAVLLVAAIFSQTGCAYLKNRGRDFTDILTLSVEDGNFGAIAETCSIPCGVSWSEGKGVGLRSGCAGMYGYKEKVMQLGGYNDGIGEISFEREFRPASARGNKGYYIKCISAHTGSPRKSPRKNDNVFEGPWQTYTQFAANLGLYGGIRLGFNVGELSDFLIGWTTLDICRDDVPEATCEPADTADDYNTWHDPARHKNSSGVALVQKAGGSILSTKNHLF